MTMRNKHNKLLENLRAHNAKKMKGLDTKIENARDAVQTAAQAHRNAQQTVLDLEKEKRDAAKEHKKDEAEMLVEQMNEITEFSNSYQSATDTQVCALRCIS